MNNFRYAFRALRGRPSFAIVAISALALGIGLNTAIFSVVETVLLRSLPFPDPDALVSVREQSKHFGHVASSDPNFKDWSREAKSIAASSQYRRTDYTLSDRGGAERIAALEVSADFFRTVGIQPAWGRAFSTEEDRLNAAGTAVLADGLWRRRFGGEPSALGRSILLNGKNYTILGVMPPGFAMPGAPSEILLPAGLTSDLHRDYHRGEALARLQPGVRLDSARAEFASISLRLSRAYPATNGDWSLEVTPLHDSVVADVRPALLMVLGAVGLVLLIACANVANLLLVRASERGREMAVRASLGATQGQLAGQLLAEALLLSLSGGALGVVLAGSSLRAMTALLPVEIAGLSFSLNTRVLLFTTIVSLLTAAFFGLIPALGGAAPRLTETLKEGGRGGTSGAGRNRLRSVLAGAEIAIALVLAAGAGLLTKSYVMLQSVDPGFAPAGVVTMRISIPEVRYPDVAHSAAFWDRLLDSASGWNGVSKAGLTSFLPLTDTDWQTDYLAEGEATPSSSADTKFLDAAVVSPDYFAAMGIPVSRGRTFAATDDATHPPVVVVDDSLARGQWPGQDPLGKRIRVAGMLRTVAGVAGHVKPYGLDAAEHPQVYFPYRQMPRQDMTLVVRSAVTFTVAGQARETVRQLDPAAGLFNVALMRKWVDDSMAKRRFSALLLSVFSAVALLLAALGVYGVMSYSVAQRFHEMGIRLALGASPGGLRIMVVRQGLLICMAGTAAGLVAAFGLTRAMSSLLFQVAAGDPVIFAATAALLAAVAAAASYLPARRASRADPMTTLRYE